MPPSFCPVLRWKSIGDRPWPVPVPTEQLKRKFWFFHTVFYFTLCLLGYDAEAETLSSGGRGDMALKMGGKVFIMEFKARGRA
jgi:hypothetical protein